MNWSRIKTVIVILLAAVNLFLALNLFNLYRNTFVLFQDTIEQTVGLLAEEGIQFPIMLFPEKKSEARVLTGSFSPSFDDYYVEAACRLAGVQVTDSVIPHMMTNGIRIIMEDSGDIFEFYSSGAFDFQYVKKGDNSIVAYWEDIRDRLPSLEPVGQTYMQKYASIVGKYLFGGYNASPVSDYQAYGIRICDAYYDADTERYLLTCIQTAEGLDIAGCTFFCIFNGNTMLFASGSAILTGLQDSYSTQLYDQVNIMLMERMFVKSQRGKSDRSDTTALSEEETNVDGETTEKETYTVTGFQEVYCISWSAEQDQFYLVPAWHIEYNGKIERIRNAINGKIYTT